MRAEDELLFQLARGLGRGRLALGEAGAKFADLDGPAAFGFSSRDGHARENVSRTGRWVDEAARLARRLAKLPRLRAALREGRLGWSMAELLARKATPETEAELLALALVPGVTVHAMRDYLRCDDEEGPAAAGGGVQNRETPKAGSRRLQTTDQKAERDPSQRRRTIEEVVPAEIAALVEATRLLLEHLCGGVDRDWFEYLLAEGLATDPDLLDYDALQKVERELRESAKRIADGQARRAEAEERAEPDLPRNAVEPGDFPEPEPLPDDVKGLDAVMRRTAMQLASRDLVFGRIASDFFRSSAWRELGYATDTQYCQERLGMSRGAVWNRITLARRCTKLPALAEAVSSMEIGFEAALLVARIATPATEKAWIARAKERMFKPLKEEVRAAEASRRLGETAGPIWPPTDEEMADDEAFERDMLSGDLIGQHFDDAAAQKEGEPEIWIEGDHARPDDPSDPIQISASANTPDRDLKVLAHRVARAVHAHRRRRSKGEVTLRIRTNEEVARFYRAARKQYRDDGRPSTLLVALCTWCWQTWIHEARQEQTKWHPIHRRDRFRCASPGCTRRLCTLHHIIRRMLGGDDRWTNLLTLCEVCHLKNVHELGSLQIFGEAPSALTFVFGQQPFLVVRGREKRPAA